MESKDRSLAAQVRATEAGRQARLCRDADGVFIKVKSDTRGDLGKFYRVTAHCSGEATDVIWSCKPSDWGQPGRGRDHGLKTSVDGIEPCMHCAAAAQRLERAGLVRWVDPHVDQGIAYAGRWVGARPTSPVVMDELTEPEPTAERQATDAPGYRGVMRQLAPLPEDPFAAFAGSDQR